MKSLLSPLFVLVAYYPAFVWGAERIPALPHSDLNRLFSVNKPQPNESPWRMINWITNVTEAREKAIAEDKPLVIFTAADGSPIGRT